MPLIDEPAEPRALRYLVRARLDERWASWLAKWTSEIAGIADRADRYAICVDRWKQRRSSTETMRQVQRALIEMNGPLATHCMYCEYNEANHLDHFEPRQRAPERTFEWENLFWACGVCDTRKRERFEEACTGLIPACPTDSDSPPERHLRFLSTGAASHLTERGRWTCNVFDLDREALQNQRRDRWFALTTFLPIWAEHRAEGDASAAQRVEDLLRRPPFLSVLRDLLRAARTEDAELLGLADVAEVIARYPEVLTWTDRDRRCG